MSSRIALLGGMFDPVHNGHIEAARYALRELKVDRLKMIPCHSPNHKDSPHSNSRHRLAMLEAAIKSESGIEVDPLEINRSGVSYTVDTLLELKRLDASASLVFVLGIDAFNSLPQWHRWLALPQLCHFLVLARSGAEISQNSADQLGITQRLVSSTDEMFESESGKVLYAKDFSYDLSSTAIRQQLMSNQDARVDLNEDVLAYIKENQLYGLGNR